eukprot:scaffold12823_cov58-Cyclotella_meneghiniana.AAC.3
MENAAQIDEADIKTYNDLDDEIVELILSTAKRVGRVDFGYQRSADLCIAGKTIRMHKAILSCIMNDIKYTESLELLATELNHQLPSRDEITVRQALTNVKRGWRKESKMARGYLSRDCQRNWTRCRQDISSYD